MLLIYIFDRKTVIKTTKPIRISLKLDLLGQLKTHKKMARKKKQRFFILLILLDRIHMSALLIPNVTWSECTHKWIRPRGVLLEALVRVLMSFSPLFCQPSYGKGVFACHTLAMRHFHLAPVWTVQLSCLSSTEHNEHERYSLLADRPFSLLNGVII